MVSLPLKFSPECADISGAMGTARVSSVHSGKISNKPPCNGDFQGAGRMETFVLEAYDQELEQQTNLLHLVDDAVAVTNTQGQIIFWNRAAECRYGWTREEVLGRHCGELLHAAFPDSLVTIQGQLLRNGRWEGEVVHTARDGAMIVSDSRWSLRRNSQGEPIAVLQIEHDVTLRKQASEALRRSDASFRSLFASIPFPTMVYDAETLHMLEVNDAAIKIYGYSRDEFLRMTIEDPLPPEQLQRIVAHSRGVTDSLLSCGEWKQCTREGRTFDAEILQHTFDFAGQSAVLVLVEDITKRKQLELELRQSQKLESIGQLAAGIAHEINTPTQFVGDNVQFLQDAFKDLTVVLRQYKNLFTAAQDGTLSREVVEQTANTVCGGDTDYLLEEIPTAIQQTLEGLSRISTLVKAMKEFSHPGSKEKLPQDLNQAIQTTVTVARNEWKYVADVETDFDPSLPHTPCLVSEFNQVILNLLINAAHAIGEVVKDASPGKGRIKIRTHKCPEWAEIQIEDTGAGIPEAVRERVFDPFFTTKPVGKGTGQGLTIARSVIVDKHGGTLRFETEVGKGTTFIVRLPYDGKGPLETLE